MDQFLKCRGLCALLLFLCMVGVGGKKLDDMTEDMEFHWRTEKWKTCRKIKTCDEPGIRRRALLCVSAMGEKVPTRNCDRNKRPKRKEFCVVDECIRKTKVKLELGTWQDCKADQFFDFENSSAVDKNRTVESMIENTQASLQLDASWKKIVINSCRSFENAVLYTKRRNATCTAHWSNRSINIEISLKHCLEKNNVQFDFIKLCSIGCKQHCSLGLWSSWKNFTFSNKGLKFRTRNIAHFPYVNNDTSICPPLVDLQAVKERPDKKYQPILYEFYEWGKCKRLDPLLALYSNYLNIETSAVGIQKRTVKCIGSRGSRIDCDQSSSRIVATSQVCILSRNCQVSKWSAWSRCEAVYFNQEVAQTLRPNFFTLVYQQRRTRKIRKTQLVLGRKCPHLLETRHCEPIKVLSRYEQRNSTFENSSYLWFEGSYTKCKLSTKDCGSGTKQRNVFCTRRGDKSLRPVGSHFCAHTKKPAVIAFCRGYCKDTCVLGEWSSWSTCTADCTSKGTGAINGTHYRVRRVLQYSGDPSACPDYAESRPCTLKTCISWTVGTQTICLMDNIHRACGNGKTHRAVYCMNARGQQVNEGLCKEKKPPRSLPCHVPCADDCVLGAWSSWGSCQGRCSVNGTQVASYRSRKRRILANPGWSGRPCPDKRELMQTEPCLGESCGTFHWNIGTWGPCRMKKSRRPTNGRKCVFGTEYRAVYCVNEGGISVKHSLCSSFLKPPTRRECRLCPEDCVLSPWSVWSECPNECKHRESQFYHERQRFVIRPSLDGGKICPTTLIQSKKCTSCNDYVWVVTGWSNCTTLRNGDCKGFKTRRVFCVRKVDSTSQAEGNCLAKSGKPKEYTACTRGSCKEQCILAEWNSWEKCSKICGSGFTRRNRNPLGNRADCERNTNMVEERSCNTKACGQYSLRIGKWSRCYPSNTKSQCGAGQQWRNVTCFKISGRETALDYCIEELYGGQLTLPFERRCSVKCPLNCILSPWTEFTPCSRKCGSGIKTRFRTVVQKATHGGQVCNTENKQITETVPCIENHCYNYVWETDPWSHCKLINQTKGRITKCGTGTHTRIVHCTDQRHSGSLRIVNDSFCDAKERPITSEPCTLYCPGDCVVGDWTKWSKCSSVCPRPGHRRRERTALRYPAHNGKRCPVLEEHQRCNLNHCFAHYWRPTKWSSCLFYQDDMSCGIGRQRRLVDCIRNDGKIVHPFHCRVEGRRIPALLRMCTVPCPRNCEISEWGTWSNCQNKCGAESIQRRSRFILARAENGGQSCLESEPLNEFRSCPMKPCYKVIIGRWGKCKPYLDQACGYGRRRRSVHCERDDGELVDEMHCPEMKSGIYSAETNCKIPCQGDCIVSEWSSWSSCFAMCTLKNQSMFDYGTRIRIRHILQEPESLGRKCPRHLMEREICYDQKCFTFSWKTGPYVKETREVWCQRSDGLRVFNGCEKGLKPSRTETCQPKCSVSHSFCNEQIVCACKNNFIPIFSSHGYLIHCLSNSNQFRNDSNDVLADTSSRGKKDPSWFADLPIIIWVVIGVCFIYLLLFLAIVIVYTRRRRGAARQRKTETADVGTLTSPERVPLTERPRGHERTESKVSFATSSGRGSTLSTIGCHDDGEQWPEPPDNLVSEFIRQHLQNFNNSSICSAFNDESLNSQERMLTSTRAASFDASGTL